MADHSVIHNWIQAVDDWNQTCQDMQEGWAERMNETILSHSDDYPSKPDYPAMPTLPEGIGFIPLYDILEVSHSLYYYNNLPTLSKDEYNLGIPF